MGGIDGRAGEGDRAGERRARQRSKQRKGFVQTAHARRCDHAGLVRAVEHMVEVGVVLLGGEGLAFFGSLGERHYSNTPASNTPASKTKLSGDTAVDGSSRATATA